MNDKEKSPQATTSDDKAHLERRAFIKQAAATALIAGVTPSAAAMAEVLEQDGKIALSTPLKSRRVIKSEHKQEGNRQEGTVELELIDSRDLKLLTSNYIKRVDDAEKYDVTIMSSKQFFRSAADTSPFKSATSTMIMSGKKGAVAGEYRTDEVVITVISDGQVVSREPVQMKVLITDQFKGMSASDLANHALDKRFGKQKGDE